MARFGFILDEKIAPMTSPAHSKAQSYLQRGIFDGLKNFRQLEKRIGALATTQERGNAFEVFTEAYLATLAVEKARQVWPGIRVPDSLRKRLGLPGADKGVDGVFETQLGEYHAYQVKFRTGRPSLTWDELSTFIGLADRVDQRVLITNCDRFADVIKQRTGFYAITGNDLDKLEPKDFAIIRAWLEGARVERKPKTPLQHQAEALDDILPALREHDRATALMACGTGKTLVALWVAEQIVGRLCQPPSVSHRDALQSPSANILVLVPSLALLRQTLHEWARETSWPSFAHLCVCSDPTVKPGSDELVVRQTDLDFPVTTDSTQVCAFLAAKFHGVKLVFSTYQSAHVVAAGMKRGNAFDLAIFDEAHKTAGREGVHFGFALNDKNLAIRKRLFLTATPRHYDVRKRDKEGDARLVYSMDAPEVYGPVAHKLTFAEAARRGIICNYKVIISVVTSDMVTDHLLRHGEVIVKGDAVKARQVANQLALQAAVEKHGVSKIFTFHRSVASAAAFTSDGPEGIGNHLSGFDAFHVNGSMPTSERENIMTEFRAALRAVISNAKCLTEGVDVPAVDMVAFLTPKRSRVDIVQATGRAMRKAEGKTTGYVLVPLFVEQAKGETIEEALARTEFDEVWNVLQAMQEQDDILSTAIKEMREERGRTKGFDDTRFREKVKVLGPQISLESLRDSIATSCVEALGDNWDERFGQLRAFKEKHGDCLVPTVYKANQQLANWVRNQRNSYSQQRLSADRIKRLEELGFEWDSIEAYWQFMFAALKAYKQEHGDCRVAESYKPNRQLASWVFQQRAIYSKHQLSAERIKNLEEIGFEWNAHESGWQQMFAALKAYKQEHGDCRVRLRYKPNPQLATWVATQRNFYFKQQLSADRIKKLEELGFEWDSIEAEWQRMFADLKAYKEAHGDCRLAKRYKPNPKLVSWAATQRTFYFKQQLSAARIKNLEELGFAWDPREAGWQHMFAALKAYRQEHGDCRVSRSYKASPQLAKWVKQQRADYSEEQLSTERIKNLEEIGFEWNPDKAKWEEMFSALKAYKQERGDCRVPQRYGPNQQLATWVNSQRRFYSRRQMSADRIKRLEEIGFVWILRDSRNIKSAGITQLL
jgi:superfamily II DNA or RNA helicase